MGIKENVSETTENLKKATGVIAKRLDEADQKIDQIGNNVSEVKDNITAKINDIKTELNINREQMESITGTFDQNSDGKVSLKEAKEIILSNKSQWTNVEFWFQLLLAILGITVGKKALGSGTSVLAGKLHEIGRVEIAKRRDASADIASARSKTGNTS